MNKITLIMTVCISPQKDVPVVYLKNVEERLEHYKSSLRKYIERSNFKKIIFCDNSNFDWDYSEFVVLALKYKKTVEFLKFEGDKERAVKQGKGYGDAEIVEYAVKNSQIIEPDDMICKVSGRYFVENIDSIIAKSKNTEYIYAVPSSIKAFNTLKMFDAILWVMNIANYNRYFSNNLLNLIDDRNKKYYEHVFYDTIKKDNLNYVLIFPKYDVPFMGSTGANMRQSSLKLFCKKLYAKYIIKEKVLM